MGIVIDHAPGPVIGLIGDTHLERGADLPMWALDALADADMIVHLGDLNTSDVLDVLEGIAPTVAVRGGPEHDLDDPRIADGYRVIVAGSMRIGVARQLDGLVVDADAREAFGGDVAAVAFGATHTDIVAWSQGTLLVNPGSPNIPIDGARGSVALLTAADDAVTVRIVSAP